jgi:hypothetical protein
MPLPFVEGSSDASFAKASILIQKINSQLNQDLPQAETVYQKISLVDTTSVAQITPYVFQVAGGLEAKLGYDKPISFGDSIVEKIYCEVDMWGSNPGQLVPIYEEQDPYHIVQRHANEWMRQMPKIPDRRLAELINANGNWADNTPFFGTHVVNRNVKSDLATKTFTNDITVSGSPEAWYLQGYDTLRNILGYDGTRLSVDLSYVKIVCSSMTMGLPFIKLFNAGINAEQIGGAAGSTTTRLVGSGEVIVMPELYDPNVPGSDRRFYMIASDMLTTRPPFITRIRMAPQIFMSSGGPDDLMARNMSKRGIWYKTSMGVSYGLPHKIVRATVTG